MRFDRDKFKRLIHYVIWKAGDHDGFGATKLYKVLWFSEARQFVLTGAPITGASFIREKYGPVPREGLSARKELAQEGKIRQWQDRHGDYSTWRMRAVMPPDTSGFAPAELDLVNYWIKHIDEDHTAASISEQSHDYGWEIARMGEELPLYAFLAQRGRESKGEELAWARRRAKDLGLI